MRKRLLALLLLAAAATIMAQAVSAEGSPPHDSVTGSGKIAFTDFPNLGETTVEQFEISAHSGPGGENVRGTIVAHSPLQDGPQIADVTCLIVTGDRARVGGEFREAFDYMGVRIRWIEMIIQDNGSDDMATGFSFLDRPRPPSFSPCNFDGPTAYQVVRGNYVVRDGTSAPGGRIR